MVKFREEVVDRITNIKKCNIPDMGKENPLLLFDEYNTKVSNPDGSISIIPHSQWKLIYDAV